MELPQQPDPAEEEVPEIRPPGEIARQFCVLSREGTTDPFYRVGTFEIDPTGEGHPVIVPLICIAEVDNQLLVAVPVNSWHRTVANRVLPPRALLRPVLVALASVSNSDREVIVPEVTTKAWLADLRPEFEECLDFETEEDRLPVFNSEDALQEFLPAGDALVQVAEDRFSFLSAMSEEAEEPAGTAERISRLEESIVAIRTSLADLAKQQVVEPGPVYKPNPKQTPKTARKPDPAAKSDVGTADGISGLNPEVVTSALHAGIERSHLEEFARMMGHKKTRMGELPKAGEKNPRAKKLDVLGESDEEVEDIAQDTPIPEGTEPMTAALLQLTKIVSRLSNPKSQRRGKLLEDTLEEVGAAGDSSTFNTSNLSSKRHAQVLRALKRALKESPAELYEAMKEKMIEDCGSRVAAPGSGSSNPTFRSWAEHRSRVPNLGSSVRTVWAISGALDAFEEGRIEEGKARLLLYLGMMDQVAIGRGSWVLANAGSLEDAPPFGSFGKHVLPDMLEPQHSKLWPAVWADAFMHQIREQDEFLERKSKLGRRQQGGVLKDGVEQVDPGGKGQKGKKGKGKGNNSTAAAETAPASSSTS